MWEFLPELSTSTQTFVRTAYGALMIATLVQALPEARRFFVTERWGGYTRSSRSSDFIQNPVSMRLVMAVWLASAAAIAMGWATPWPALVNLVLCRYFFIQLRWKSVLRGMGAPGFMAYWTGLAVFLLEYTHQLAPHLRSFALWVLQIDLALVMLSAGIYKVTAGYPKNHGMELGLCNPMWGYWWRRYKKRSPDSLMFWAMNQQAWATEVAIGVLALLPATRELGGVLLIVSFTFILTQIRLGFLCEMVIVCGLLYVPAGSLVDGWIEFITGRVPALPPAAAAVPAVNTALGVVLWVYLMALPFAHAGLYYNFYRRRVLPGMMQQVLERYTNLFGVIIWRVFSVDLVNFFVRLWREPREGGPRVIAGHVGSWPRFNHVGEMICLTSLFTTLKYYPNNVSLFHERILRYTRTLSRTADEVIVFEYVSVVRHPTHFDWVPVAEYRVDPEAGTVDERMLDPRFSTRAAHAVSPLHEGTVPGSYAPAQR